MGINALDTAGKSQIVSKGIEKGAGKITWNSFLVSEQFSPALIEDQYRDQELVFVAIKMRERTRSIP